MIDTLRRLVRPLGSLASADLLTGGQFATTYRVTMADGSRVVVIAAGFAVVATLAAFRTLRGDAGEHVHDSVEAGSPSATGGAAVAACEIAESVEPARSVGTLGP